MCINVRVGADSVTENIATSEVFRRELPKYRGIYVEGSLQGVDVVYTVDTGASCTIVSRNVFEKISEENRPTLCIPKLTHGLSSADGKIMKFWGKADMDLVLGSLTLKCHVSIADIEDEVLLGADVLQQEGNTADILLSRGVMLLRGIAIPLKQVCPVSGVRKVSAVDDYVIPGLSEAVLDGYIERSEGDRGLMIVESGGMQGKSSEVIVGPSLVDPDLSCTVKVRVLNPTFDSVVIHHAEVIAQAEEVHSIEDIILEQESELEHRNYRTVRSINFDDAEESQDLIRNIQQPTVGTRSQPVPAHLETLFQSSITDRDEIETDIIKETLLKYSNTFSTDENDLGLTHLTEHAINTGNARPVRQPPRRTPIAFQGEEHEAIMKLQRQGSIRPSTSPWASPLVLVRKKNGKVRPCVDYRRVNAVTEKDAFPIPRVQDCLDAVAGSTIFSTLDITSAYHQIPVRQEDIAKTAFCSKYGLWEFINMPFGLCNATATFQRMLELALRGLQWTSCLIYLDDVIIFGSSFGTHLTRLQAVLDQISAAKLKLSPSKCCLFKSQVTFLGHVLSKEGILPNPDNVSKMVNWPTPTSVTDVRAVLGLGSYYRRFVKDFAEIVRPMTDLTRKDRVFKWDSACQHAFDQLKQILTSPSIMAYPTEDGSYILDTDACGVSIGAVLSQIQANQEKVIAYGSRTMSKSERNYCVTDRELLAVKYFVDYYKHYLLGRTFVVRSDHQALKWLFSLKEPKNRIARWIEILSAFSFSIEYRPGKKHGNADSMSRCPDPRDCQCEDDVSNTSLRCGPCEKCRRRSMEMQSQTHGIHRNTVSPLTAEDRVIGDAIRTTTGFIRSTAKLREEQRKDPDIGPVCNWMKTGLRPSSEAITGLSAATRHYCSQWDSLFMKDGVMYRKFSRKDGTATYHQFVVPKSLRSELLHQVHNNVLSGHLGRKKTREKTLRTSYWFGLREDVDIWVAKCDDCEAVKLPHKKPKAPLGTMITGAPWDRLSTDLLGPLPLTPRANRYILVVTDSFTKWVEIFAVQDQTATTCATIILNEVIARFGCPLDAHTDQGRNFESAIFADLCRMLGIRKTRTSPANPQCNGQTERLNRTLIQMIKCYLRGEQENWDLNLGCMAAAYRATPNETTHLTPNLMMFGRENRIPVEVMYGSNANAADDATSYGQYVSNLRDSLARAHDVARKHLGVAAQRQKDHHDAKSTLHCYKQGDLVWYFHPTGQQKITPKLRRHYEGPVLILKRINDINYVIQMTSETRSRRIVHHNKLKPYRGNVLLRWAKAAIRCYLRDKTKL